MLRGAVYFVTVTLVALICVTVVVTRRKRGIPVIFVHKWPDENIMQKNETVPSITSKHNVTLPPQKYQTYKAKDNCNKERKKLLLQLMITAFKGEMLQEGESPEGGITAARIHAVEWKFDKMDVDKDKNLVHSEYHPFRRQIRQWDGVRKCSRSFVKHCDKNRDKVISKEEWVDCTANAYQKIISEQKFDQNPFLYLLKP